MWPWGDLQRRLLLHGHLSWWQCHHLPHAHLQTAGIAIGPGQKWLRLKLKVKRKDPRGDVRG